MAAWAGLIRPPFLRYSSGVEREVEVDVRARAARARRRSWPRRRRRRPSRTPISARIPTAIDAEPESTTWISRSASMSRAMWALLIVPDSSLPTSTQTIASAPRSKQASKVVLEVAGAGGGGRRERRAGREHPLPEGVGGQLDAGPEALLAEADDQRDDDDPGLAHHVGRQIGGGIGDDRDARHGGLPPPACAG